MAGRAKARSTPALPALDPTEAARDAHLRYVHDDRPGLRRRRSGGGFRYLDDAGHAVRDRATLDRIRALAIPPAWTDVWICPHADGHIQATGRDARGRKQYRYHARWRTVRDATKYEKMIAFGAALPKLRKKVDKDLSRRGLPREKVLAAIVRLLDVTLIRVGNDEYARDNHSYGLTTLRDDHVDVSGSRLRFHFRGKSGVVHEVELSDRRMARIVAQIGDLPGHDLFQYVDDEGATHAVASDDVNGYLATISGDDSITAKDFRTWAGTVLAACALAEAGAPESAAAAKRSLVEAVKGVAERLGNTPAVCRKCYIHPGVVAAFEAGALPAIKGDAEARVLALLRDSA